MSASRTEADTATNLFSNAELNTHWFRKHVGGRQVCIGKYGWLELEADESNWMSRNRSQKYITKHRARSRVPESNGNWGKGSSQVQDLPNWGLILTDVPENWWFDCICERLFIDPSNNHSFENRRDMQLDWHRFAPRIVKYQERSSGTILVRFVKESIRNAILIMGSISTRIDPAITLNMVEWWRIGGHKKAKKKRSWYTGIYSHVEILGKKPVLTNCENGLFFPNRILCLLYCESQ